MVDAMLPESSSMNRMFGRAWFDENALPMNSSTSSAIAGAPESTAHSAPANNDHRFLLVRFILRSLRMWNRAFLWHARSNADCADRDARDFFRLYVVENDD
jgi:hypothetical protein